MKTVENIDEYISGFPTETQKLLKQMRATIREAAPEATEKISYGMPTFDLHGNLVHFAGYKNHIGFYPSPSGIRAFHEKLSEYKNSKGAVQFPIDKPLPLSLISEIVAFRVMENKGKASAKKSLKICKEGHKYFKSSDCPTCPVCEEQRKPGDGFLSLLAAPARRALESAGITSSERLATWSEKEILQLHGIGKASIPVLLEALRSKGLTFKKQSLST